MNASGSSEHALYKIMMSIRASLGLDDMLHLALSEFMVQLDCRACAVLFFDGGERGELLRVKHSVPSDVKGEKYFAAAAGEVNALVSGGNFQVPENFFPRAGESLDGNVRVFHHIFLLPHVGLLFLFRERGHLDENMSREVSFVAERFAEACFSCLSCGGTGLSSGRRKSTGGKLVESEEKLKITLENMRLAQEELLSSKNHLALILQTLAEGVVVFDKGSCVSLMNTKAMEYLDYMPDLNGKVSVEKVFANAVEYDELVEKFIFSESVDESRMRITVRRGRAPERILMLKKNGLRDVFPDAPEIILLVQDITKEEELDRLKNEFISNLSHELRTPLNAILGISAVLAKKDAENLTSHQMEGLELIESSGRRLLSLINDILDISKIEAGKMNIASGPVDVRKMLLSVRSLAQALIGEKDIVFAAEVSPDVPETVVTDERRIVQVISNLVGNSVKFTDSGNISIMVWRENDRLYFSCTDSGIGISAENLPYVFDRFRQVDGSARRRFSGTGIGLSLSRDIIGVMGGGISASSVEGKSTRITFFIPLVESSVPAAPDEPPLGFAPQVIIDAKKKLILVAEDEIAGRKTALMALAPYFNIAFASNGDEAVRMYSELRPDLVLMDIMMPQTDGYEALKKIRAAENGMTTPVIALTAYAMEGEKKKICSSGFNYYISKPYDPDKLVFAVSRFLSADDDDFVR